MIELPEQILARIEELLQKQERSLLSKAFSSIQERYRGLKPFRLETMEEHLAYLVLRLPGTFAACAMALKRLQEIDPEFQPKSLLDLGAGPGTFALASSVQFSINEIDLIEQNQHFIELGNELLKEYPHTYHQKDFRGFPIQKDYDLITASYSLSESEDVLPLIHQALNHCTYLVIVEPGTPFGFSKILKYRTYAIENGAHVIAPCPHNHACPMTTGWCHFSERLPRTEMQQYLKKGTLGYEDEKYCYLVLSTKATPRQASRIIHTPKPHSGHVELALCTPQGNLENTIVSKRHKELYKRAKKSEWGDLL